VKYFSSLKVVYFNEDLYGLSFTVHKREPLILL